MIQAHELRVGNWVERLFEGHKMSFRVTHLYHCIINYVDESHFAPTPLTEEILLKCGFESATENNGNLPCFRKGKYTVAKWVGNKWQFWISTIDIFNSPQHLHQLQNLYFALTGEELTVNL